MLFLIDHLSCLLLPVSVTLVIILLTYKSIVIKIPSKYVGRNKNLKGWFLCIFSCNVVIKSLFLILQFQREMWLAIPKFNAHCLSFLKRRVPSHEYGSSYQNIRFYLYYHLFLLQFSKSSYSLCVSHCFSLQPDFFSLSTQSLTFEHLYTCTTPVFIMKV